MFFLLVLCSDFLTIGCTYTGNEDFELVEGGTLFQDIAEVTYFIESIPVGKVTPIEVVIISTEYKTVTEEAVTEEKPATE